MWTRNTFRLTIPASTLATCYVKAQIILRQLASYIFRLYSLSKDSFRESL